MSRIITKKNSIIVAIIVALLAAAIYILGSIYYKPNFAKFAQPDVIKPGAQFIDDDFTMNVFPTETDGSGSAVRGTNRVYSDSISLNGHDQITIEATHWITSPSRLPIVLQLINKQGEIKNEYKSHAKGVTVFHLPKSILIGKNGYTVKVSNQRDEVLMNSILDIPSNKRGAIY